MKKAFLCRVALAISAASIIQTQSASWDSTFASDFDLQFNGSWGTGGNVVTGGSGIIYAAIHQNTSSGNEAYIGKWTASTGWQKLADSDVYFNASYSSGIHALAVWGTDLYVGGSFDTAGIVNAVGARNIARYSLSNGRYFQMGNGLHVNPGTGTGSVVVRTLLPIGGHYTPFRVYAGGYFSNSGRLAVNNVAYWNGLNWSSMSGGVHAMGDPTTSGGPGVKTITGLHYLVNGTYYQRIFVGGTFKKLFGSDENYNFAMFQTQSSGWERIGSGNESGLVTAFPLDDDFDCIYVPAIYPHYSTVSDFQFSGGKLIIAGHFNKAESLISSVPNLPYCTEEYAPINVVTLDYSTWTLDYLRGSGGAAYRLEVGPPGVQFTVSGTNMYFGGNSIAPYDYASGITLDYIYSWNAASGWGNMGLSQSGRPTLEASDLFATSAGLFFIGRSSTTDAGGFRWN